MKKSQFSLQTLLFLSFFYSVPLFASDYTTLKDGDWDDTEEVWSLDNETPCNCSPGRSTEGNDITISHNTTMSYDVQITHSSTVNIQSSGFLEGDYEVKNLFGSINNYGSMEIANYSQGPKSTLNIMPNGFLEVNHSISIGKGELIIDAAKFILTSGNCIISRSGKLTAQNNAIIDIEYGNIISKGKVILMNSAVLYTGDRSFKNTHSGTNSKKSERTVVPNRALVKYRRKSNKKL